MILSTRTVQTGLDLSASILLVAALGCTPEATSRGGGWSWPGLLSPTQSGEEWTILCLELMGEGPNRTETVERLADALRRTAGLDATMVRTLHDDDASRLYYGVYRPDMQDGRVDFAESDRALVQQIRSLAMGAGHPFLEARLVPVPTRDVGPPEWEMKQCEGPYTLNVAEFYNDASFTQRKEVAVKYCGLLRDRGLEAYYWHGPRHSLVCVGSLKQERDFVIQPEGIVLGPAWQKLVESDSELKFKTVNGRYVSEKVHNRTVRQRAVPIPCPDRPPPSGEDWMRRRHLEPLRR